MITTEQLKNDLITVKNKLHHIPSKYEYAEFGQFGSNTVYRRFGTWNNAMKEIFGYVSRIHPTQPEIVQVKCIWCGKQFEKYKSRCSKNNFCNKSHAASYNNTLKRKGTRSKCESLLFEMLTKEFPALKILPNDKDMLNGYEIDIAIPELKLGIEWNGIVHFQPIYGQEKLNKIQKRDKTKIEIAAKRGINLIVIPDLVSQKKYVIEVFHKTKNIILDLQGFAP